MQISKSDELFRITLTGVGIKFPKSNIDIRDAELDILKSCIEKSANDAPAIPELRQRMRMLDELDGISSSDNYVDLSKSDIELIKSSFTAFAGRRPGGWLRCYDLQDQLEAPKKLSDFISVKEASNG